MGGSYLQRGFDLLILPDYLLIFPNFLKILHENEIILSQRGVQANHLNPLWIRHCLFGSLTRCILSLVTPKCVLW